MKIGIDIDGTITEAKGIVSVVNDYFGTNLKYEDIVEYNIGNILGVGEEEIHNLFSESKDRMILNPTINENSKELINEWCSKGKEIYIITARNESLGDDTLKWLNKLGINYDKLYMLGSYGKARIIREEGIDFFLEDRIETVLDVEREVPETINFLIDTPYNQGRLSHQSRRVKDWYSIEENVGKILQY